MNKKVSLLALGLLAGAASAATAVVWSDEGEKVTKEPAYFYTFAYEEGSGAAIDTTNVNGAKVLDFKVPMGKTSAGAGYGFAWQQNATTYKDVAVSLSTYKGVCLVYEAEAPFRVDFKQSTITDDNYYGYELDAAANPKKVFVAFADLTQGWKSATAKTWAVGSQTGVQFSYKNTHANTAKSESNAVILHSFTLGTECVTYAPNVTKGFSGYNGGELSLDEGKLHTMDMKEVFEDADGDDLVITVKIVSETKSVVLVDSAAYDQSSIIKFTTAPNPKGPATVTLTATDPTKKTATFSFTINTVDTENLPVAKDFEIEVPEDSSYKNGLTAKMNNLKFMGTDADGDTLAFEIVSEPEHGEFTVNTSTGMFTYAPEKDYFGKDCFTYRFYEVKTPTRVSNVGTATIIVTPVNDAPKVTVVTKTFVDEAGDEHDFGDTLTVDEDFEKFSVFIPAENITVTDPDGDDDIVYSAKASGIVNASYSAVDGFYGVEISAIKDANGVAKVTFSAGDHKIAVPSVICYIKVEPVADDPRIKDDSYTIPQDSLFKVAAKNGVLANDENPDDVEVTAVLVVPASNGEVTLAEDGSFTYKSEEGFEGEDAFGYVIAYGDGDTTDMAVVSINVVYRNHAPEIVEGVLDTVGNRLAALKEDFTTVSRYSKAEVLSWFTDDQDAATALTFSVRSDDSLLAPSIASGIISIKAVKDACGDAEVIVTAKDKNGATTDLKIPASISCVNDKPVVVKGDTVYVDADSAFSFVIDLTKYISDPDGEALTYTVTKTSEMLTTEVDGDSLYVTAAEDYKYTMGSVLGIGIKGVDAANLYVMSNIVVKFGKAPSAIKPMIAAPKATWQNAILANRGVAAIFDMQGRVMWKLKLPVSESDVRNAAAQVQGRKILQVNRQVYTIK